MLSNFRDEGTNIDQLSPSPNDKILNKTSHEELADNKINVSQKLKLVSRMIGKHCWKKRIMLVALFSKASLQGLLTLYSVNTHFDALTTDSFENIMAKEETACYKQFLFFPHNVFYSIR